MKRIGIVTLNGNTNYGNRLQNYALKEVLTNLNNEVSTIWFVDDKIMFLKDFLKKFLKFKTEHLRYLHLKKFTDKYLNVKYYFKKGIAKSYDYFVVGSDQVWNWVWYTDFNTYYLKFSPREKNIAYAASFAVDYINDKYKNEVLDGLKNIKSISVREESGRNIVHNMLDFKPEVVLDPTMLLERNDWEKIIKKPKKLKNKKFILVYFLGDLKGLKKTEIERIAKENDCEIIEILNKNSEFYTCGPEEFLYLIKNAFLICTDSFHSCVFSIIFDRPFVVFNREQKKIENISSRIDTLINKFKLKNRKFEGKITEENLQHEYQEAYKILKLEREKSLEFLKHALNKK